MKIGVISDIHGNKEALDRVFFDMEIQKVEKVFCLGDLAMGGYDMNYTIQKIFSYPNLEIIQGNTDKMIVNYNAEIFENLYKVNPLMASALKLDNEEITPENRIKIGLLPEKKIVEIYGVKFMLCHGSPRKQDENLRPDTPVDTIEQAVKEAEADIILCGHTHIPCGFSLNSGKIVINVGSVGRSMTKDKIPVYLLITVNPDGSYTFEHRKVKYDNKKVAKIIEKRNFEFAKDFSKLYIEEK